MKTYNYKRNMSLAAAFLLLIAVFVGPAFSAHDLQLFELDGDAYDDPNVPGADWSSVNANIPGPAMPMPDVQTGVLADPAPLSIFTQGGSKDIRDITEWRHKNGSVPDKDDITNAYAAAYNDNGNLIIYFGADRFDNKGDAFIGYWFFQDDVSKNSDGTFTGEHKIGDILVLSNFSNGGSEATIQVLEWVGSGGDQKQGTLQLLAGSETTSAKCGDSNGDQYCAITNEDFPVEAFWAYTPKGGVAGDLIPVVNFFEGGINISSLFPPGEAPCFTSFMAETRSSTSVTAQLKDFVLGEFEVCGISIAKECIAGEVNADQTGFLYTYSLTVTNTGVGTLYDVTAIDDAGTPEDTSDDIIINVANMLPGGATADVTDLTFESTLNPPTNGARVEASPADGGEKTVTDGPVYDECPQVNLNPLIDVSKACETSLEIQNNMIAIKVSASGQVCNPTGPDNPDPIYQKPVNLLDVWVSDDKLPDSPFLIGNLAAGECKPYGPIAYYPGSINSTVPSEVMFTDTVTATGTAVLNFGTVEDTATATCLLCE